MAIKIIDPVSARATASRILQERYGFQKLYGNFRSGSMYFMLPNHRGRKLRVSDHGTYSNQHGDVAVSITLIQPTIEPDVCYQVDQAVKKYKRFRSK